MTDELNQLRKENAELRTRNTQLQNEMSELVNNQIHRQVHDFMSAFNQPILLHPGIPEDSIVKLRAELQVEEGFEFAYACFDKRKEANELKNLFELSKQLIREGKPNVDLVALVDATLDSDYVSAGARWTFGVRSHNRLKNIVHKRNMAKAGGPKDPVTGKHLKPEGWYGPEAEIEKCLINDGWIK